MRREEQQKCDLAGSKSGSGNRTRLTIRFTSRQVAGKIAVNQRDQPSGLYVGYVPDWAGAHLQGESRYELRANLHKVMQMLLKDS